MAHKSIGPTVEVVIDIAFRYRNAEFAEFRPRHTERYLVRTPADLEKLVEEVHHDVAQGVLTLIEGL